MNVTKKCHIHRRTDVTIKKGNLSCSTLYSANRKNHIHTCRLSKASSMRLLVNWKIFQAIYVAVYSCSIWIGHDYIYDNSFDINISEYNL